MTNDPMKQTKSQTDPMKVVKRQDGYYFSDSNSVRIAWKDEIEEDQDRSLWGFRVVRLSKLIGSNFTVSLNPKRGSKENRNVHVILTKDVTDIFDSPFYMTATAIVPFQWFLEETMKGWNTDMAKATLECGLVQKRPTPIFFSRNLGLLEAVSRGISDDIWFVTNSTIQTSPAKEAKDRFNTRFHRVPLSLLKRFWNKPANLNDPLNIEKSVAYMHSSRVCDFYPDFRYDYKVPDFRYDYKVFADIVTGMSKSNADFYNREIMVGCSLNPSIHATDCVPIYKTITDSEITMSFMSQNGIKSFNPFGTLGFFPKEYACEEMEFLMQGNRTNE